MLYYCFLLTRVIAYETNCSNLELFFPEELSHSKCTEICSTVEEGSECLKLTATKRTPLINKCPKVLFTHRVLHLVACWWALCWMETSSNAARKKGSNIWKQPEIWTIWHQWCFWCCTDVCKSASLAAGTRFTWESYRLPPSQIPDPFLKKCSVWCYCNPLDWPSWGQGWAAVVTWELMLHSCCTWLLGKLAPWQVSRARLNAACVLVKNEDTGGGGKAGGENISLVCKHLPRNKRIPEHTEAGLCSSEEERLLLEILWPMKSVGMLQQAAT